MAFRIQTALTSWIHSRCICKHGARLFCAITRSMRLTPTRTLREMLNDYREWPWHLPGIDKTAGYRLIYCPCSHWIANNAWNIRSILGFIDCHSARCFIVCPWDLPMHAILLFRVGKWKHVSKILQAFDENTEKSNHLRLAVSHAPR